MSSLITGKTVVPSTETLYGCNWKSYPVVVDPNSDVYTNRNGVIAIIDKRLKDPIVAANLNVANLCPIAEAIQRDYSLAIKNYHLELKTACEKDKGRNRQVSHPLTLSVGCTFDKLVEEFQVVYHRSPTWWEKAWLGIKSVFVARTVNEITINHFPDEYNDYHRREWMVQVLTQEKARISKALHLITQGSVRYASNIKDALEEQKPVHDNDKIYLKQLIELHNIFKPGEPFELPDLGQAKKYLEIGESS